jgi:phage shock protein A
MALMLGNLHDALTAAGATPELARKAAEEVAGYENRLAKVEAKLDVLQWMVGANIGLTLLVLGRTFFT